MKRLCKPIWPTKGSRQIAFVGEAPGEQEEITGIPFMGAAGDELRKLCADAEVDFSQCLVTNVLMERPPGNNLDLFCCSKKELPSDYPKKLRSISSGKYLRPEYLWHLKRLEEELLQFNPNVTVAFGNPALWALCGLSGIAKHRGVVCRASLGQFSGKVIPAFHPANVLREYSNRGLVVVDLMKALRESRFPEIRVRPREIWLDPTIADLYEFRHRYMDSNPGFAFDIETSQGQHILCISIAPTPDIALVVPFVDRSQLGYNYWKSPQEEFRAWSWLREVLQNPLWWKLGQNGLYDIQYLWRYFKIKVLNYRYDAMIHHHSVMPEMAKSLRFLSSVYSDEIAWKDLRESSDAVEKREE